MTTRDEIQPKAPTLDQSGQPVNVVERDIEQETPATEGIDKVITPTSIKEKEQDAETLQRKTAEIERKVADGR
jgi:hypothetical protein